MSECVCLRNGAIELHAGVEANSVVLVNPANGSRWRLDPQSLAGDVSGLDSPVFGTAETQSLPFWEGVGKNTTFPLILAACELIGSAAALLTFAGSGGRLVSRWELEPDGLTVTALASESSVTACSLPGAFRPEAGGVAAAVVPLCQGVWHRDRGPAFSYNVARSGHAGWSMPFFALAGDREALLQVVVDEHDARLWFARGQQGGFVLSWIHDASLGRLGYDRRVRLRFTEPTAAGAALAYRRQVAADGGLKTWDEKVAERPELEKIFGSLMCFIGYCRDDATDYAASLRRLRDMGFERALIYPLAIGNPGHGWLMGGREAIDISRLLPQVRELGYLAASWIWIEDVPGDPADNLLFDAAGQPLVSWQIEERKWYKSCPKPGVALAEELLEGRLSGYSAHHFDVSASRRTLECFHPAHPLDRRGDAAWRRRVLETAARRGCAVSSEGFWGYATPSYDIGSVKLAHALGADFCTVPLTSLVYHDCCIHDWWEGDNYNNPHGYASGGRGKKHFPLGGGHPAEQAAMDALAGWPPNVFAFGAQYKYVEGRAPETEIFTYNLDMPEVRAALDAALPVCRLHRRIGRAACVDHRLHASDGTLQSTSFANGVSVYANFGATAAEIAPAGLLPPMSWRAVDAG